MQRKSRGRYSSNSKAALAGNIVDEFDEKDDICNGSEVNDVNDDQIDEYNVEDDENDGDDEDAESGDDYNGDMTSHVSPSSPSVIKAQLLKHTSSEYVTRHFKDKANKKLNQPKRTRRGKTTGKKLPPNITKPLSEAQLHYANRNYNASIELLSKVIKIAPRLADSYLIIGRIYEDCHDNVKAIQFYALAALYTPKPYHLSKKIALLAMDSHQYEQSLAYIYKALKQNPDDVELLSLRIFAKIELNDVRSADFYLKILLDKYPSMLSFYIEYGERCQQLGLVDVAINAFTKYIQAVFIKHQYALKTHDVAGGNNNDDESIVVATSSSASSSLLVEDVEVSEGELSDMFYACRRSVDLLLEKPAQSARVTTDHACRGLKCIQQCKDFAGALKTSIQKSTTDGDFTHVFVSQTGLSNADGNEYQQQRCSSAVPTDIVILEAVCLLRTKDSGRVDEGVALLTPILRNFYSRFPSSSATALAAPNTTANPTLDSASSTAAETYAVSQELLLDDDSFELESFFIRQLMRVSDEYTGLGSTAQAKRAFHCATTSLQYLNDAFQLLLQQQERISPSGNDIQITEAPHLLTEFQICFRKVILNQIYRKIGLFYEINLKDYDTALTMYINALQRSPTGNDPEALLYFVKLVKKQDLDIRNALQKRQKLQSSTAATAGDDRDASPLTESEETSNQKLVKMNGLHRIVQDLLASHLPLLRSRFIAGQQLQFTSPLTTTANNTGSNHNNTEAASTNATGYSNSSSSSINLISSSSAIELNGISQLDISGDHSGESANNTTSLYSVAIPVATSDAMLAAHREEQDRLLKEAEQELETELALQDSNIEQRNSVSNHEGHLMALDDAMNDVLSRNVDELYTESSSASFSTSLEQQPPQKHASSSDAGSGNDDLAVTCRSVTAKSNDETETDGRDEEHRLYTMASIALYGSGSHTDQLDSAHNQHSLSDSQEFNRLSLKQINEELMLLLVWADYFYIGYDFSSYLCIAYSFLLSWVNRHLHRRQAHLEATLSLRQRTSSPTSAAVAAAADSNCSDTTTAAVTAVADVPSVKKRRKPIASAALMTDLQRFVFTFPPIVATAEASRTSSSTASNVYNIDWLDDTQKSYFQLVASLCYYSDFSRSLAEFDTYRYIRDLTTKTSAVLVTIGRQQEAEYLEMVVNEMLSMLYTKVLRSKAVNMNQNCCYRRSRSTYHDDEEEAEEGNEGYARRRGYGQEYVYEGDENDDDESFTYHSRKSLLSSFRLSATRRLPSESEVLFVSAAKLISTQTYEAALLLVQNPSCVSTVNNLVRVAFKAPDIRGVDSNAVERCLPVLKLYSMSNTECLAALMFNANDAVARRRYTNALDYYFKAYKLYPDQPLVSLCIGLSLIFLSQHFLVNLKPQVLVKALGFMDQYRQLRCAVIPIRSKNISSTSSATKDHVTAETNNYSASTNVDGAEPEMHIDMSADAYPSSVTTDGHSAAPEKSNDTAPLLQQEHPQQQQQQQQQQRDLPWVDNAKYHYELGLQQEVFYNLGRAYQELKLFHLAVENYKEVLRIADNAQVPMSAATATATATVSLNRMTSTTINDNHLNSDIVKNITKSSEKLNQNQNEAVEDEDEEEEDEKGLRLFLDSPFSLTREAAFNLVSIYKQKSKATNLAYEIMCKYLTYD